MISTLRFRAYASSRINVERDAEGRVWTQLFPLGTWHRADFPNGKIDLTPKLLAEFITSWKGGGSPPLPVDYDHKEDGPASGWIEDLRQTPTGELEGAIKWTDEAAEEIKADKRRYLSPTWAMQHTNRRTGEKGGPWLYGAALLNDPFYDSMPRVAASQDTPQHRSNTMNEEQLNALRAKLGLAADSTPAQIIEATETLKSSDAPEKLTAAVKLNGDLEAKLKASQEEVTTLKASLEKAESSRFTEQVAALVADAKREGRPVDALIATDIFKSAKKLDDVKALLASVPVSVPLKAAGVPGTGEKLDAAAARKQYDALIATETAKGTKYTEAARLVAKNNPELSAIVFTNPTNSNTTSVS